MDLNRYKSLLTATGSRLSEIGDTKGERFFLRWLRALDELKTVSHPNLRLRKQVAEVQRSTKAIVILATERYLSPTAVGNPKQAELESDMEKLLRESAQIMKTLDTVDEVLADRGLPEIVNEFLSSVEFVMDYVQLRFFSSTLTALTSPEVREGHSVHRPGDSGYRDALCRRIGVVVREVEVREEQELAIAFNDDSSVHVSLRAEDSVGPESATFSSASGGFWVW